MPSLVETNKEIVRRFLTEVVPTCDLDLATEFIASNYLEHRAPPEQLPGIEGFKQAFRTSRGAFPDGYLLIEEMIAEGDKVVVRTREGGTLTGEGFMGIPPTGKKHEIMEIHIFRVEAGKITEHWSTADELDMLRQLAVIPENWPAETSGAGRR